MVFAWSGQQNGATAGGAGDRPIQKLSDGVARRTHNEYDLFTTLFRMIIMVRIETIPLNQIHRPLYRQNDPQKVVQLMESIQEIGLQEPIDVLEVEGQYYGFSGCHRYEACSRLGHETILCRVRRAPRSVLNLHLA
jgi:uncharacterized ParB-like nuclease family protein